VNKVNTQVNTQKKISAICRVWEKCERRPITRNRSILRETAQSEQSARLTANLHPRFKSGRRLQLFFRESSVSLLLKGEAASCARARARNRARCRARLLAAAARSRAQLAPRLDSSSHADAAVGRAIAELGLMRPHCARELFALPDPQPSSGRRSGADRRRETTRRAPAPTLRPRTRRSRTAARIARMALDSYAMTDAVTP
jgi:hypothetical protein